MKTRPGFCHATAVRLTLLSVLASALPVSAGGVPVFDVANMKQNTISAIEGVNQTMKMIEQYQLQLLQYENMLRNTMAPAAYVWNRAQLTTMRLMGMMNTVNYYRYQAGSLDGYLYRYQNPSYYMGSPCFGPNGCTPSERAILENNRRLNADGEKLANDAMIRSLDQQQLDLKADAERLEALQKNAQDAPGQMAAIQAANQLASNQAAQLMQIRALLIAQQNAEATRQAKMADIEAQQAAAAAQATSGTFKKSTPREW
ncbi:P-type conjugative transfer protein TrbJ [Nitrosospira sp. Nsp5]|uniref:P-type conjugative transfer protein TrbJ n=1 Tax=Nitrosospira multiformis TaxID=1231 RepID=A0ABY0TMT8_9PROT|nr:MULTISPECIES: P-type conjugative transfer protein TrbJ [Nitrosospira]PTR05607.1 P-type conjugative transfer protein TrbJ [Nitrosospira sp. Nsp5]SDR11020.1 P-type conjugative transfer protein TrbJ [Nitrosospira multiformis]